MLKRRTLGFLATGTVLGLAVSVGSLRAQEVTYEATGVVTTDQYTLSGGSNNPLGLAPPAYDPSQFYGLAGQQVTFGFTVNLGAQIPGEYYPIVTSSIYGGGYYPYINGSQFSGTGTTGISASQNIVLNSPSGGTSIYEVRESFSLNVPSTGMGGELQVDNNIFNGVFSGMYTTDYLTDVPDVTLSITSTAAPEIDSSSAASGLTLLLGSLMVLRGRRPSNSVAA